MLKRATSYGVQEISAKRSISLALPMLLISSLVSAADRSAFYTIIGPNGQVIVIDRNAAVKPAGSSNTDKADDQPNERPAAATPSKENKPAKPTMTATKVTNTSVDTSHVQVSTPEPAVSVTKPLPTKVAATTVKQRTPAKPVTDIGQSVSTTPSNDSHVTTVDGVQYVESEYLERKEFNLDDRKKFYSVPNGVGGTQVIERTKGVDMSLFHKVPVAERPKVIALSPNYQRIDAQEVESLTGVQCFSEKQLKRSKPVKANATTDFWPRPSFEPKFDFVVAKFEQDVQDIELTSYASTRKDPKFYWPLPIFLDDKGCVMEGVHSYYGQTLPATMSQYQALQGYLHVPAHAHYLLLTPLEAAVDMQHIQLSNQGQIRLMTIR